MTKEIRIYNGERGVYKIWSWGVLAYVIASHNLLDSYMQNHKYNI